MNCGQFTPMITKADPNSSYVHFFPKNGNQVIISGQTRTIPPGIGVISGGVVGDSKDATIDLVPHKVLQPLTVYYAYVYMDGSVMKMNFSQTRHIEEQVYGNQVNMADPSQSLVGMVRPAASGLIEAGPAECPTISWFNRGTTGLCMIFGVNSPIPAPETSSPNLVLMQGIKVGFLTFGINNAFRQAFTVPNIYITGTICTDTVGSAAWVTVAVNGQNASSLQSWRNMGANDAGTITAAAVGAAGAEEGWVEGQLMMCTAGGGGIASMPSGMIYTSPVES